MNATLGREPGESFMSDEIDWNFVNEAEAKAELRAAVEYLLRGTTDGARGDIVSGNHRDSA
jgi:hypothetical protein